MSNILFEEGEDMPLCPFKKKECISECPYFAQGVKKCCLTANTMLLEDLHKLSLAFLDNAILAEKNNEDNSV